MKTEPFAWWHKAITRRIREQVGDLPTALAVYACLCELASDTQRNEGVTVTQEHLARMAGLTRKTVGKRLDDLERVGAIRRQQQAPGPRCADAFDLLDPMGNKVRAMGNGNPALGNGFPALGTGQGQTVSHPYTEKESITPRAKPKRLTPAEGIRLNEERRRVEAELGKLQGLRSHERENNHESKVATLKARLENLNSRLSANADAITAGGDA